MMLYLEKSVSAGLSGLTPNQHLLTSYSLILYSKI